MLFKVLGVLRMLGVPGVAARLLVHTQGVVTC